MEPVAGCVGEEASPRRVHGGRLLVGFLMKVAAQGPRYITAARCYQGPGRPGPLNSPDKYDRRSIFLMEAIKTL